MLEDPSNISQELYQQILKLMPLVCVDLLIRNKNSKFLMLRRKNNPERGSWWFPGGRVQFGEQRKEAVFRKLDEECGFLPIDVRSVSELATCDLMLTEINSREFYHAVTTVFLVEIDSAKNPKLDNQSSQFSWQTIDAWQKESLHPFLRSALSRVTL